MYLRKLYIFCTRDRDFRTHHRLFNNINVFLLLPFGEIKYCSHTQQETLYIGLALALKKLASAIKEK